MTDPMTTERLAEISERLTTPRLGRSMARETDLDLLAIRALLAEVRRLQAAVERVREPLPVVAHKADGETDAERFAAMAKRLALGRQPGGQHSRDGLARLIRREIARAEGTTP